MNDNGGKTGWPPGLLQDDNTRLSKWFASKPDARRIVRQNLKELYENAITDRHGSGGCRPGEDAATRSR